MLLQLIQSHVLWWLLVAAPARAVGMRHLCHWRRQELVLSASGCATARAHTCCVTLDQPDARSGAGMSCNVSNALVGIANAFLVALDGQWS